MSAPSTLSRTRPGQPGLTPRFLLAMAAIAGLVSALATLAAAEVISLLLGGVGEPILAVGSLIIDLVPPGFKTLVIDLFDTADKLVLVVSLGLVVLILAVVAGWLQLRRPPLGVLVLGLVGVVALVAAITRADATVLDAIPTVVGTLVGAAVLRDLGSRLARWRDARAARSTAVVSAPGAGRPDAVQYERRSFIRLALILGVTSAVVGAGARVMTAAASAVNDLRASLRLPVAAVPAAAIPAGTDLDIEGLSPFITPNTDFYRIDTALQVPSVDQRDWSLRITGMVEQEVTIGWDELVALPLEEHIVTLACVSNEVGGDLIGNALWLGYPIRELLKRARPTTGADMVLSRGVDGFSASTPIEVLQDENTDALLAVGMNGEPLPLQHGFPVRMVVPGLYGYVSATKWVIELKVTTFADDLAYWSTRGWTELGPIKLSSRIDTPRNGVSAGTVAVAGVAWAQHTGISAVEVRVDDGAWQPATLAVEATVDAWVQWSYAWDATPGSHRITVRATDADGLVQTADEAPPAPDGSTGLHTVTVNVG